MKVKVVQLIVDRDISRNKNKIIQALKGAEAGDWMIFPEAILSGYYPQEETYTLNLDWNKISKSPSAIVILHNKP